MEFPSIMYPSSDWGRYSRCLHGWPSSDWRSQLPFIYIYNVILGFRWHPQFVETTSQGYSSAATTASEDGAWLNYVARAPVSAFIFYLINITFLWLQHACWRFTACQFVLSFFIKLGKTFAIEKFPPATRSNGKQNIQLTFPCYFPLQITARPNLDRGAGIFPLTTGCHTVCDRSAVA